MKYKQSSSSKQIKKQTNVQIRSTIMQQWQFKSQNPKQMLPYSLYHIYLSKVCDSFHTIKFFCQNTDISMQQKLQNDQKSKLQMFQQIQHIFISRLRYPFQKMKQLVMFSDESLSSQPQTGLDSYMRMIQLRKVMQDALASLQPVYQTLRKKALMRGLINLKNYIKEMKKHEMYNDEISLGHFCQTAENIIRNKTIQSVYFAFQKIASHSEYESRQITKNKQVKIQTFDTFGKNFDERFENISLSNQSQKKMQSKKYLNRQNVHSRQKKFITRTENKNHFKQSNASKQQKKYININDYQDQYENQNNHQNSKNQETHYQNSRNQEIHHQNRRNQEIHQQNSNKYVKKYQQEDGLEDKINQMPTQRTNYRYSNQEQHYESHVMNSHGEDKHSQKYSTPFHRVQYEHLPITQRIQKNQFRSEEYYQNQQQISQSQAEGNIVQQIYIIRNHKQKPKRKPDHFVKVPILSSDINVVQIQNPGKRSYQYEQKKSSYYRQHACKDCKYCTIVKNMQAKISMIKKLSFRSFKTQERSQYSMNKVWKQ